MEVAKYPISLEIKGIILGVRQVQNRGRVQIPKSVRIDLKIADGDHVYWVKGPDGKIYILKAVAIE